MGRLETIVYECDWCKTREPAVCANGYSSNEELPDGWKELEYSCTMCQTCLTARDEAIAYARHMRLNGWPLAMNDSKPASASGDGK